MECETSMVKVGRCLGGSGMGGGALHMKIKIRTITHSLLQFMTAADLFAYMHTFRFSFLFFYD